MTMSQLQPTQRVAHNHSLPETPDIGTAEQHMAGCSESTLCSPAGLAPDIPKPGQHCIVQRGDLVPRQFHDLEGRQLGQHLRDACEVVVLEAHHPQLLELPNFCWQI